MYFLPPFFIHPSSMSQAHWPPPRPDTCGSQATKLGRPLFSKQGGREGGREISIKACNGVGQCIVGEMTGTTEDIDAVKAVPLDWTGRVISRL